MNAGDTFVPAKFDNHLWIVLSDPGVDPEKVVIVNLTTHTVDEEQHCIIKKGEHVFVKHKTAVRYSGAKTVSKVHLETLVERNLLAPHRSLSEELLIRVRNGAGLSEFLPEGCRQILERQGLL